MIALKAGHKVIATSRNPSQSASLVQDIKKLGGMWLAPDVDFEETEINRLVEVGWKNYTRIDVLVNNAAVGILGAIEDTRYGFNPLLSIFQYIDDRVVMKKLRS